MTYTKLAVLACAGLALAMLPSAKADEWNQKTIFTFNAPVEIPGQVLNPGTYVFKLADSQSDRNIVQVFNKNETHLYGTFLAIPDYHLQPRGKPIITFEERAAGAPEAVRAWFYPGDNYGHEFVYPKARAMALAKVNNEPVPSMPNAMATNTTQPATTMQEQSVTQMKEAPLTTEQPQSSAAQNEQSAAQNTQTTPQMAENQGTENRAQSLPHTASPLPLIGLVGLMALGGGRLLRTLSKRMQ